MIESGELQDAEKVLEYLNDIIERDQNNAQVYYKRAQVYLTIGDYRRAGIDVQKAVNLKSTDPDYYLLKSSILDKRNNSEESIAAALQAEQRGLRNYQLYRLMAVNYLKLNDAENAKKSIQRLLDFNRNGENLSLQADILLELKDTTAAISSYKLSIEQQSDLIKSYRSLFEIYRNKGNEALAEQYVDAFLQHEEENKEFLIKKARLLTARQSYDSALTFLNAAGALQSEDLEVLNITGKTYYSLQKYDTSLLIAERSWEIDSLFVDNALLKARSLDKLGNYAEAQEVYTNLVKSDSTLVIASEELDILNRKVAYLWRLKQQEEAFESIRNSPPPAVERKEINN
ncbi:tetratricopeptide repeat protein [Fulvivirga lutimaris]|uniref:tetratricopeptide repeat protein n=1 Tax=Fulvivirga lutimaris TaxID=1819566 RepID=UPI0016292E96|nr:tetratricopeptide repeat protein [Fulvivirga lutimaris]